MKITKEEFDAFWESKGRILNINNKERTRKNLGKKIEMLGTVDKLDEYVESAKTGKESTRKIVAAFYDYLSKKRNEPIESSLYDKQFFDFPIERQLEIAKFLHNQHTSQEILEKFCIDEVTLRNDLKELENGITVFGSTIQIERSKIKKEYYYKSTLHPIFLPLNLTEVYALTVYLDRVLDSKDKNTEVIKQITSRIKGQLSDYAIDKLFPEQKDTITKENIYNDDEKMSKTDDGSLMYLMKSGQSFEFIWNKKKYTGTLDYCNHEYKIRLMSGEYLDVDVHDVEILRGRFEYK